MTNTKFSWRTALKLVDAFQKAGREAYFVGGASRDFIQGTALTGDVDIATNAKPLEIKRIIAPTGIRFGQKGENYGSFSVAAGKEAVEITSFRREGRYSDARHPDKVNFVDDYETDAARRDFTINAIYLNPITKEIKDPFGGIADLKAGLIRAVGDPKKKIDQDHLRMLRAVRFAAQMNFRLEKNTYASIKTRAKLIQTVSGNRVRPELEKIILSANPIPGIKLLDQIGLLRFILPELSALKTIYHRSDRYHLEGDVYTHSLMVLGNINEKDFPLRFAALLHDAGKATTGKLRRTKEGEVMGFLGHDEESSRLAREAAKRLYFPRKTASEVSWLIWNNRLWPHFESMNFSKKTLLARHPHFPKLIELWRADSEGNINLYENGRTGPYKTQAPQQARKLLKLYLQKKSFIEKYCRGGYIIKTTKLKPGKKIGKIIDQITEKVIANEIRTEASLKNFLQFVTKKT